MHDVADQCNRPGPDTYVPSVSLFLPELIDSIQGYR